MEYGEINRPGEDIVLDYAFSGSVVCKTLEIRKDGALYGLVEASSVKVAGTFEGAADCDEFIAGPGARGRGAVFAGRILVKDGDAEYYQSSRRPSSLRDRPGIAPSVEQAIDRGIAEALAARPKASAAPDDEVSIPEVDVNEDAPNGGLTARLAAMGVAVTFPEESAKEDGPAAPLTAAQSPARPAGDEFPQLV
jgi:hypothetical protein